MTDVGTKSPPEGRFDNYEPEGTKSAPLFGNGNYSGFVRVRRRQLKGGRAGTFKWQHSMNATVSASYDLVRSVRVNGKPRHKFVLGLGSQKSYSDPDRPRGDDWFFWCAAIARMREHGLSEQQRHLLVQEIIRKGARLPAIKKLEEAAHGTFRWRWGEDNAREILGILASLAEAA